MVPQPSKLIIPAKRMVAKTPARFATTTSKKIDPGYLVV
jgi:hypothetical protein